jgi:hypothetical protein
MKGPATNTHLIVAHESMETRRALSVEDFDDLCAIIGIHWREKASWLDTMLNHRADERR